MSISKAVRLHVRNRAKERCEYCQIPEEFFAGPFHPDHVRSRKHGGTDKPENLAWACQKCNQHKGSDQAGYDPHSGDLVALFNPRTDAWQSNFEILEGQITGINPRARATCGLLQMNTPERIAIRLDLINAGLW